MRGLEFTYEVSPWRRVAQRAGSRQGRGAGQGGDLAQHSRRTGRNRRPLPIKSDHSATLCSTSARYNYTTNMVNLHSRLNMFKL
jgi:hypothetical protein